jgi:hypothetical protein
MLTTVFIALAIVVILLLAAWFLLDMEPMEVTVPIGAPIAGAIMIYYAHDTPAAWAVGLALIALGTLFVFLVFARRRHRDGYRR